MPGGFGFIVEKKGNNIDVDPKLGNPVLVSYRTNVRYLIYCFLDSSRKVDFGPYGRRSSIRNDRHVWLNCDIVSKKMRCLLYFHNFFITLQEIAKFMTDSK